MVDRASDYGNKTPQFLNSDSFLDLATGGKAEDRVSKGNASGGSLKISVIFFFSLRAHNSSRSWLAAAQQEDSAPFNCLLAHS